MPVPAVEHDADRCARGTRGLKYPDGFFRGDAGEIAPRRMVRLALLEFVLFRERNPAHIRHGANIVRLDSRRWQFSPIERTALAHMAQLVTQPAQLVLLQLCARHAFQILPPIDDSFGCHCALHPLLTANV